MNKKSIIFGIISCILFLISYSSFFVHVEWLNIILSLVSFFAPLIYLISVFDLGKFFIPVGLIVNFFAGIGVSILVSKIAKGKESLMQNIDLSLVFMLILLPLVTLLSILIKPSMGESAMAFPFFLIASFIGLIIFVHSISKIRNKK